MSRRKIKILIVTPAPRGSKKGNRVTAERWARFLIEAGHQVSIATAFDGQDCELLIALHARYSSRSIRKFKSRFRDRPIVVAITGTDLYRDLKNDRTKKIVLQSLQAASRVVVLHPAAVKELPRSSRAKTRVIYQSLPTPQAKAGGKQRGRFAVAVIGHLRPVKDPFRTAMAVRSLPASSKIQVLHIGAALTDAAKNRAMRETVTNSRYRWLGELSRNNTLKRLGDSQLLVLSSKMEGGANVISEAIVCGTPVLASRISGSLGLLGADYPGFYPVGNTLFLRKLLLRAENDQRFYDRLKSSCARLKPLFAPQAEADSWKKLLGEI